MKKILFISSTLHTRKLGSYLVSNRNFKNISQLGFEIENYIVKSTLLERIFNIVFFNRLCCSSNKIEKDIIKKINLERYDLIFIDNSGFGYLVEKIKTVFENIKIIVFCHDVNYYLFSSLLLEYRKERFSLEKLLRVLIIKKEIYNARINEEKSFKFCDKIITLNNRDTNLVKEKYGYISSKEIGITLEELQNSKEKKINNKEFKLLFVGAIGLKANVSGIEFFIKEILPKIECRLIIVGKGMEKKKKEFEKINSKVEVIGTVEKLDEYYLESNAVIAPIFAGGGMKVKTAEALSCGKTVFGTTEAFEGYEVDYKKVGGLCNTAEEFIESINKYIEWWKNNDTPIFNEYSYQIFKEKYSYEASLKKFKEVFEELEEMEK